ncbi:McrB family protein [Adlercreutzia caecimuris]|uniref:McrB family protein n=1 Tax=Adlercreutzia caecimuris TaxID=671266 RepID=UPI00272C1954|nr:AAA family ATPase [Adlercreutzia caecimuris]
MAIDKAKLAEQQKALKGSLITYLENQTDDSLADLDNFTYAAIPRALDGLAKSHAGHFTKNDFALIEYLTIIPTANGRAKLLEYLQNGSMDDENKTAFEAFMASRPAERPQGFFTSTGFFPMLTYLTEEQCSHIVSTCISINEASADDAASVYAMARPICGIKHFGAGFLSGLLHSIKPTLFPILNTPGQNLYRPLAKDMGINPKKLGNTHLYADNAEKIKRFTDQYSVVNFRVIDRAQFEDPDVRAALAMPVEKESPSEEPVGLENGGSLYDELSRRSGRRGQREQGSLNTILYGPPGTGKTYQTVTYAVRLCDPEFFAEHEDDYGELFQRYEELVYEGRVVFCTFHQSYCYEEFIEGIKPVVDGSAAVRYEIHSGIFKNLCDKALADEESTYLLIADEINRGNISRVFGELITLLEPTKRLGAQEERTTVLPYSGEPFGVPDNLYVLGTMNTADRSLTQIDTALRRRFEFVEVSPDPSLIEPATLETDEDPIELQLILEAMNARIAALYDRDHAIGHSYLMGVDSFAELKNRFELKIVPLLQEYFYDDYSKIRLVLNDTSDTDGFIVRKGFAAQYLGNLGAVEEPLILGKSGNWKPSHFMAIYGGAASATASE